MFTREELNDMYKDQLIKLAGYYKIEGFSKYWTNAQMVEVIYNYISPKEEVTELPQMSARVRRIYETNKE